MNEERLNERDSQLSAMFDDELPAAECELLARRLVRDDVLRAQWSRYSMIGAALRAERGIALHDRVATRVQATIAQEATYGNAADTANLRVVTAPNEILRRAASRRWARLVRPMFGAGIAASVAAASILFLRAGRDIQPEIQAANPLAAVATSSPDSLVVARAPAPTSAELAANRASNGEPRAYTTPSATSQSSIVPPARLANYVVAHSEYSGPLSRRMALLGLVATDGSGEPVATPDTDDPNAAAGAPNGQ
jgi:sigma-E factor negative regulatory protein RseA